MVSSQNPSNEQPQVIKPANKGANGAKKGSTLGGIIVILVFLALIAWAVTALSGGGSKKAATVNSKPNNTAQKQPPATNTAAKITAWDTKYGYIIQSLQNDFGQLSKDAGNSDVAAVGKDCQQINTDITTAQSFPAIPDAQSASDFSSALTYYQEGSSQCVTAINNNDANGLVQAAQLMSQGTTKISATAKDITKAESQ